MTIDTRHLKRGDVVLTWAGGGSGAVHRAIVDDPARHAPDPLVWREVASTEPVRLAGRGARRVHFTDGTSATASHSQGWIEQ